MLGVAALIVVLSVMNGFERELRSRILSVTSHATLMGLEGALPDWRAAREVALRTPGVREAVPYVELLRLYNMTNKTWSLANDKIVFHTSTGRASSLLTRCRQRISNTRNAASSLTGTDILLCPIRRSSK